MLADQMDKKLGGIATQVSQGRGSIRKYAWVIDQASGQDAGWILAANFLCVYGPRRNDATRRIYSHHPRTRLVIKMIIIWHKHSHVNVLAGKVRPGSQYNHNTRFGSTSA